MSRITDGIKSALVWVDNFVDFTPLSPISGAVDLIAKQSLRNKPAEEIKDNRYFRHIKDKDITRCCISLIPGLGFLINVVREFAWTIEKKSIAKQHGNVDNFILSNLENKISDAKKLVETYKDHAINRDHKIDNESLLIESVFRDSDLTPKKHSINKFLDNSDINEKYNELSDTRNQILALILFAKYKRADDLHTYHDTHNEEEIRQDLEKEIKTPIKAINYYPESALKLLLNEDSFSKSTVKLLMKACNKLKDKTTDDNRTRTIMSIHCPKSFLYSFPEEQGS